MLGKNPSGILKKIIPVFSKMLFQPHMLCYILEPFWSICPFREPANEMKLMDEITWRYLRVGLSSIFTEPNRHLNMPCCVGAEGDVCIFPMATHSPLEALFPPLFLFCLQGLVLWDFWLKLELLTEELHELEPAQEKQTAQLEALPLSKASNNMKPHPASLLTIWRLTWEWRHGKIPTLSEKDLAYFWSETLLHFSLSPWTMNGAQHTIFLG